MLEYRLLGPIQVTSGNEDVALGGAKQRAVLAALLLRVNHVISRAQLEEDLWGEDPPETAGHALQMHISRLRGVLRRAQAGVEDGSGLLTRGHGYLLQVEPDQVDFLRFERLLEQGREALAAGEADRSSAILRDALDLWRAAACSDVEFEGSARSEVVRLEELRLVAVELRCEADLALGRHKALVPELRALVAQYPLREPLWKHLVVALYRSSRQAEALEAVRSLRENLGVELGIDPSPTMQDLERRVLRQDPDLRSGRPIEPSGIGPGTEIAGYRLERVLGRGATSVVYLAEEKGLGRKVALKLLAPGTSADESFHATFIRESRAAASLDHPHVIPVYRAGEADGVLFIAMRYVDGSTLNNLLSHLGSLPVDRTISVVGQVADALEAAHSLGLVHGDVKPSNILISAARGGDHVYLADFGVASKPAFDSDGGVQGFGGSFDYAAPEQMRGESLNAGSDQFSLACVALECLVGVSPWRAATETDVVRAVTHDLPPRVHELKPGLPAELDQVFARALAKRSEDRFPSCAEFASALHVALIGGEIDVQADETRPPYPPELESAVPIFGRERELEWLAARWQAVGAGRSDVGVVTGPEGIGKTRLAGEFARAAYLGGASVRYVACLGPAIEVAGRVREATSTPGLKLLVLDDVDAAEGSVVSALVDTVRAPSKGPLLVLATSRDEDSPSVTALLTQAGTGTDSVCRLGPLDSDAVKEIAALYAPAADIPVQALVEATGSIPLLIHRAAIEWARGEAAKRLDAVASEGAARRGDLRAIEHSIAQNVTSLQLVRERSDALGHSAAPRADLASNGVDVEVCPFKGLAPFDVTDVDYFFGRERLVGTLVARLVGTTMLAVIGPSGSGKSSVVRAGLVPALAAGAIPGSESWTTVVMRPGEHPASELARALHSAAISVGMSTASPGDILGEALVSVQPSDRLVLVLDQFEEIFTSCRDEAERVSFVDALVKGSEDPTDRLVVVLAIRADFYGACASYSGLAALIGANQLLVPPMGAAELRRAIELPAARAGLEIEEDLVGALVSDVAEQPGGLPLLSTALLDLWQRRDGQWLRAKSYAESGGVRVAVATLAEGTYGRLSVEQKRTARAILLRLSGSGEGDAVVRRRVPLSEFDLGRREDVGAVLSLLAQSRLITVGEGAVEVAHEALLREWPRLRKWLEEDARGRAVHRHLIRAAQDWNERGRDQADLYRGARLLDAGEWATIHGPEMNELESEFVAASATASDRDQRRRRKTVRRLRVLLAGVVTFLVLSLLASGIALVQRHRAQRSTLVADSHFLAARALLDDRLTRALLLSVEAFRLDDSADSRGALLASLLRSPQVLRILHARQGVVQIAVSPDGRTLAVAQDDGAILLFNTVGGGAAKTIALRGPARSMVFSPNGRSLAVGGAFTGAVGATRAFVQVWDPATRRELHKVKLGSRGASASVAYSEDGSELAVLVGGEVRVWSTSTWTPTRRPIRVGGSEGAVAFLPGRAEIVVSTGARDGSLMVADLRTGAVDRAFPPVGGAALSVSPDGNRVAFADGVGPATILDLRSREVRRLRGGNVGGVTSVAFTPDGHVVTAGEDHLAVVWNANSGVVLERFSGHAGPVRALAVSPDGRTLYTGGDDKTVMVWTLTGNGSLGRSFDVRSGPGPSSIAYSPDGSVLAVDEGDRAIKLLDAKRLAGVGVLASSRGLVRSPTFGAGGKSLYASADGRLVRWRLPSDVESSVMGARGLIPLAISPDGRTLAVFHPASSSSSSPSLEFLDAITFTRRGKALVLPVTATNVAISPDWHTVAVGFLASQVVQIWKLAGAETATPALQGPLVKADALATATVLRFSPNDRLLAVGRSDGRIALVASATGKEQGRSLPGEAGAVESLSFDPSGAMLASSVRSGTYPTTSLWDVFSHEQIGTALPGDLAMFDPQGRQLAVINSGTGRGSVWDLDPRDWIAHACAVAGRDLSPGEWHELLPDLPDRKVCPARSVPIETLPRSQKTGWGG